MLFGFESIFACVFASGLVFPAVAPHFHDWGICHFALPASTSSGVTTFKMFCTFVLDHISTPDKDFWNYETKGIESESEVL